MVPALHPETTYEPSCVHASASTSGWRLSWTECVPSWANESPVHSVTCPRSFPAKRRRPSGVQATAVTWLRPWGGWAGEGISRWGRSSDDSRRRSDAGRRARGQRARARLPLPGADEAARARRGGERLVGGRREHLCGLGERKEGFCHKHRKLGYVWHYLFMCVRSRRASRADERSGWWSGASQGSAAAERMRHCDGRVGEGSRQQPPP